MGKWHARGCYQGGVTGIFQRAALKLVGPPGIEPGSGASETLILSIVRRGLFDQSGYIAAEDFYGNGQQYYAKKFTYGKHSGRT